MHCEKTSFITVAGIIAFFLLGVAILAGKPIPSVTIEGIELSYLVIAGLIILGGYLGILYYRISKNKHPIFILQFWKTT